MELADNAQVVIRRTNNDSTVRVNGIPLVDPTPLIHGDKVEIAGKELLFADDSKSGDTAFVSAADIAAILASKRSGPARATAATGGDSYRSSTARNTRYPRRGSRSAGTRARAWSSAQNEVSRRHAEVTPVEGGYELRDFSANGVFVNGTRLERPQILSRADVIRVGSEEFRFYADVQLCRRHRADAVVPPPPVAPRTASLANTVVVLGASQRDPAALMRRRWPPWIRGRSSPPSKSPTPVRRRGKQFDIHVPLAHVGRGVHNDIVLADDSVSETHAKLQRRDDGWYVVDVGSTNGDVRGWSAAQRRAQARRCARRAVWRREDDLSIAGCRERWALPDTRAIAVGRSQPNAGSFRCRVPAPVAANASRDHRAGPLVPAWVWVVVVLAVGGGGRFLLAESLMVRLLHAARTDVGMIRSGNEDNFAVNAERRPRTVRRRRRHGRPRRRRGRERDGGPDARARARAGVEDLDDAVPAERVSGALQMANREHPRPHDHRGRQTGDGDDRVRAAGVRGRYLIGQVGDSRVYLLRDGALQQITKDHSYVQEQVDAGFLTPEQARYHPYSNVITRCVGASPDVQPDIYSGEVKRRRPLPRRQRRPDRHGRRPAACRCCSCRAPSPSARCTP